MSLFKLKLFSFCFPIINSNLSLYLFSSELIWIIEFTNKELLVNGIWKKSIRDTSILPSLSNTISFLYISPHIPSSIQQFESIFIFKNSLTWFEKDSLRSLF